MIPDGVVQGGVRPSASTCDSSSCSLCQPAAAPSPGCSEWAGDASEQLYASQRSPATNSSEKNGQLRGQNKALYCARCDAEVAVYEGLGPSPQVADAERPWGRRGAGDGAPCCR